MSARHRKPLSLAAITVITLVLVLASISAMALWLPYDRRVVHRSDIRTPVPVSGPSWIPTAAHPTPPPAR